MRRSVSSQNRRSSLHGGSSSSPPRANDMLSTSTSLGASSPGAVGGGHLELDKRLQWFEARVVHAFRSVVSSASVATAGSGVASAVTAGARFTADVRRMLEEDDVRRNVTAFCESDACRMLVAFVVPSHGAGGSMVRLTASIAESDMHKAPKLLCFRKLIASVRHIQPASSSSASPGGAGGAGTVVVAPPSTSSPQGASAGAVGANTASAAAASAAAAQQGGKITHDNISRYVTFFEVKPHMLRSMAHLIGDVVLPITQATSAAAPPTIIGSQASSMMFLAPTSADSQSPATSHSNSGGFPAPVKRSIEMELEQLSYKALIASGIVEGRTQLPRLPTAEDALAQNNGSVDLGTSSPNMLQRKSNSTGSSPQSSAPLGSSSTDQPRKASTVTFDAVSPSVAAIGLGMSDSGIYGSSSSLSLAAAEQLSSAWVQLLHETTSLDDKTTVGTHEKRTMSEGSAYRFVPIMPLEEIDFWRCRVQELDHLVLQLNAKGFRQVMQTLENHGSQYAAALDQARLIVSERRNDARIILKWLVPMVPYFEAISLQSGSHVELPALVTEKVFVRLFHLFYLLWARCPSPTYPSCPRLSSVIAGITQHVVQHAVNFLSLDMYFLSDPQETQRRIKIVFEVANHFKEAFFSFKAKVATVVHPPECAEAKGLWRSSTQQLLAHLDVVLERCNAILEVLELWGTVEYLHQQSLSVVEAGRLKDEIHEIHTRMHAALVAFSQEALEWIDFRDERFDLALKGKLMATIQEVMQRLGSEMELHAQEAPFSIQLVQRFHAMLPALHLPSLRHRGHIQRIIVTLCQRWSAEIRTVQTLHVENRYETFMAAYIPNHAKSVVFTLAVFRRLYELQLAVKRLLDEPYVDPEIEALQEAMLVYNATCQRAGGAFEHAFHAWSDSLGDVIARLNSPLLMRDPSTRRFCPSLDSHVTDALREVAMVISVMLQPLVKDVFAHLKIPAEAMILMQLKDPLWRRYTLLHSTVEAHYENVKSIVPQEKGIVDYELTMVETLMKRGVDERTWEDDDSIDDYNHQLASAVERVGRVLIAIRTPIVGVQDLIGKLLDDPALQFLPLRTSHVGDRTLSMDEFSKRYTEVILAKRQEIICHATEKQRNIAADLLTQINDVKRASMAPLISFESLAFRNIFVHAMSSFWKALNRFAVSALEQLVFQCDAQWLTANDGLPLLDLKLVVIGSSYHRAASSHMSPPTTAPSSPKGGGGHSVAPLTTVFDEIGMAGSDASNVGTADALLSLSQQSHISASEEVVGSSKYLGSKRDLCVAPDLVQVIRPFVQKMVHDVYQLIMGAVRSLLDTPQHEQTEKEDGEAKTVDKRSQIASSSIMKAGAAVSFGESLSLIEHQRECFLLGGDEPVDAPVPSLAADPYEYFLEQAKQFEPTYVSAVAPTPLLSRSSSTSSLAMKDTSPASSPKAAEVRRLVPLWQIAALRVMMFVPDPQIVMLQRRLTNLVSETTGHIDALLKPFAALEPLWSPKAIALQKDLLRQGKQLVFGLTIEEIRDRMALLKDLHSQIPQMANMPTCHGWLRVDCRGVKHVMSQQFQAIYAALLDHVHSRIVRTLDEVGGYIDSCRMQLDTVGPLLDTKRQSELKDFFAMLQRIRQRYTDESTMFLPMSQGLRLLSTHDHLPRGEITQLAESVEALQPMWEELYLKGISVRSQLTSLQDAETAALRSKAVKLSARFERHHGNLKDSSLFSPESLETDEEGLFLDVAASWDLQSPTAKRVATHMAEESALSPRSRRLQIESNENESKAFTMSSDDDGDDSDGDESPPRTKSDRDDDGQLPHTLRSHNIYDILDCAMRLTKRHSRTVADFQHMQILFEVAATKFTSLEEAHQDLMLVKHIWDTTISLNFQVAEWMTTPFSEVDAPALVDECRRFAAAYGSLPPRVRDWPVYQAAERRVQNLMEALPLIQDLRSSALRPRHWMDLSIAALGTSDGLALSPRDDPAINELLKLNNASFASTVSGLGSSSNTDHFVPVGQTSSQTSWLDPTVNRSVTLGTLIRLNLHDHSDFVRKLVERAEKERLIEKSLQKITHHWTRTCLPFQSPPESILQAAVQHQSRRSPVSHVEEPQRLQTDFFVLGAVDELIEALDEHLNALQNILNSRWADVFRKTANMWLHDLSYSDAVLSCWVTVQKSLLGLYPIFARSEDLRHVMADEVLAFDEAAGLFFTMCEQLQQASVASGTTASQVLCTSTIRLPEGGIDNLVALADQSAVASSLLPATSADGSINAAFQQSSVKDVIMLIRRTQKAAASSSVCIPVLAALELMEEGVNICEHRLGGFLESKRRKFPRFYFVSDVDLIDILAKEHHPPSVCSQHIHQLMSAVESVVFETDAADARIVALNSVDGETLSLPIPVDCSGRPVENWLNDLLTAAQVAVREAISHANIAYVEHPRFVWMFQHISQAVLVVGRAHWTVETTAALEQVENGSLSAMGDHAAHLKNQLSRTIECILQPISARQRKALISLITVDVHARDVVLELQAKKTDSPMAFSWQSQLRCYFHNELDDLRNSEASIRGRRRRSRSVSQSQDPRQQNLSATPIAEPALGLAAAAARVAALKSPKSPGSIGELLKSPDNVPHRSSPQTGSAKLPAVLQAAQGLMLDFDLTTSHAVRRCSIQICDTKFDHGLDYTGNCGCLVITPLTDRCYITLTQAMKLHKGGAPAGPAGTGKTETVKDVAHAMGYAVYVFNCSDQMDVTSVCNSFKGLAMAGVWGCFDEFNRIAVEVLSVVSAQVKALFDAVRRGASTFRIVGGGGGLVQSDEELPFLQSRIGVFVTMNPGYKGRTELPENVKSLFRPCAMVVPDVANIAEIMLCAEGFTESKDLARKFVRLYELSSDVLSPEAHYDWGLRAMRAVLLMAGTLKRQQPDVDEKTLLYRALRDANLAKLSSSDVFMFERLLVSLFPTIARNVAAGRNTTLETAVHDAMAEQGFTSGTDRMVTKKILQLHDLMTVRHSIFVMGATGTGKSSLLQIAKAAFENAGVDFSLMGGAHVVAKSPTSRSPMAKATDGFASHLGDASHSSMSLSMRRIHVETFDPKSLSAMELYGYVHPYSREWRDGVLSRAFREFATNHTRFQRSLGQWIILDGSIDADWIESMNSVMDDNKLLTLVNNERISMTSSMRLLFEITNLEHATPATVSRAGILYLNRNDVGWIPMKDRWMLFQSEKARNVLDPLFDKHFEKFMEFTTFNSDTIMPTNAVAQLRSVCHLLQSVLDRDEFADMGTVSAPHNYERVFLWCCVWSFGLTLPPSGMMSATSTADVRHVFSTFIKREFPSVFKVSEGVSVFDLDIVMNSATREVELRPWREFWPTLEISQNVTQAALEAHRQRSRQQQENGTRFMPSNYPSSPSMHRDAALQAIGQQLAHAPDSLDASTFVENVSLLLTGSRYRLAPKDIMSLNPFDRASAYLPLRSRFVPGIEHTPLLKLLSVLAVNEKQVLLVGESGAGKSALLRYFTKQVLPLLQASDVGSGDGGDNNSNVDGIELTDDGSVRGFSAPSSPRRRDSGYGAAGAVNSALYFASDEISLNAGSDSTWLQSKLDHLLEKRAGRQFAPIGGKRLLVILDNMNMPTPDAFGSQSALSLLRQFLEYGYWYDRYRLTQKQVRHLQFVGVVNPSRATTTANSPSERLLHKLFTFGVQTPTLASMQRILRSIVSQTLVEYAPADITSVLLGVVQTCVDALPELLEVVARTFHPAVESFHYHFTIRDLLRISQGLVTMTTKHTPEHLIPSMWVQEAMAVFSDRLLTSSERDRCRLLILGKARNAFHSSVGLDHILGDKPLVLFAPFSHIEEHADGTFDPLHPYQPLPDHEALMHLIVSRMRATAITTRFVLFNEALENICKISRVLSQPGSHAIIVGVGGSGKRSLIKLAAELTSFRLYNRDPSMGGSGEGGTGSKPGNSSTTRGAGAKGAAGGTTATPTGGSVGAAETIDVRQEFARLITMCAVKNQRYCVLLSQVDLDQWGVRQIVDELMSLTIADVFATAEERADVLAKIGTEMRSNGDPLYLSASARLEYLKQKLANNFKIVCSISPFLETMKPLLRSCGGFSEAQLIIFHEWPHAALMKVAERILHTSVVNSSSNHLGNVVQQQRRSVVAAANDINLGGSMAVTFGADGGASVIKRSQSTITRRAVSPTTLSLEAGGVPPLTSTSPGTAGRNLSITAMGTILSRAVSPVSPNLQPNDTTTILDTFPNLDGICKFLASTHRYMLDTSDMVRKQEHRNVFVTPKTFISFGQMAVAQLMGRRAKVEQRKNRLFVGLERLQQCGDRVAVLQEELGEYKKAVQQHAAVATNLLAKVRAERNVVEDQNAIALAEHQKTQKIVEEVNALVAECEGDLIAARPIVEAARAALNTLNRPNLTELKAMNNPPEPVHAVTGCVMCIIAHPARIPRDRSWTASRRMMADVPQWMRTLESLDVNSIPDACIDAIESTVAQPSFNPVDIVRVSFAAASLCAWVVNVVKYHHIRVSLRPKEARLREAQVRLAGSQAQARRVQEKCDALRAKLEDLMRQCDEAQAERDRLENLLLQTEAKLQRAQRLIASLADEKVRWKEGLEKVEDDKQFLDGDSLLGTAFSTYCGPLPAEYRDSLLQMWRRDLRALELPCSPDVDMVRTLFGEAEDVVWRNEGLAAASFMAHNAAIALSTPRWPLLLDPQHAALRWLQGRAAARSQPIRLLRSSDPEFALHMVECVSNGYLTVVEIGAPFQVPPLLLALVEKRYTTRSAASGASPSPVAADAVPPVVIQTESTPTSQVLQSTATTGASFNATQQLAATTTTTDAADSNAASGHLGGDFPRSRRNSVSIAGGVGGYQAPISASSTSPQLVVDIGADHEAAVNPSFFLVLRCAASNPPLQPDVFAQCSVVNFSITEAALSEELLSMVVRLEKPDLEAARSGLTQKMNHMTVSIRDCENLLLEELASATGDVLENERLILTLENAKSQSKALTESLKQAKVSQEQLHEASQVYMPIATRACLLYIAVAELSRVDPMYHFSMDLFTAQVERTVARYAEELSKRQAAATARIAAAAVNQSASPNAGVRHLRSEMALLDMPQEERVEQLKAAITRDVYHFIEQSLFSDHKLVFAMTAVLTVMQRSGEIDAAHVAFFLKGSRKLFGEPPKHVAEWLSRQQWEQINRLAELERTNPPFRLLVDECLETTRWRYWCECPRPETERLPGEWKSLASPFAKLLIVRALRPDRLVAAAKVFLVESFLGKCGAFGHSSSVGGSSIAASTPNHPDTPHAGAAAAAAANSSPLLVSLRELPRCSPIMFLLTPGMDPEAEVVAAARHFNMQNRIVILSMGQNQERIATEAMDDAIRDGGWILLHNAHLMRSWLPRLEERVRQLVVDRDSTHADFRLFLSCEPVDHVPTGLLQNSIKIVSEPPSGVRAHFLRCYDLFSHEPWEHCTKPHEFHVTVFSLCYFHALVVERSRFGPIGWNRRYPFNTEDLSVCTDVLAAYLEDRPRVPWEDLRYMFGEIMYGGHVTDPWDRRLCMTYLSHFVASDILERIEIAPGVPLPTTRNFADTKAFLEDVFPSEETPELYFLNPFSEGRVRLREGRNLLLRLLDTMVETVRNSGPSTSAATGQAPGAIGTAGGISALNNVVSANTASEDDRIDTIAMLIGALPELISLDEVSERLGEERTPFHHVFFQECERMNRLVLTMQRSLDAAEAAVRGTQAMSAEIDALLLDVNCDRIPLHWAAHWGPTKRPLASWLQLVSEAAKQLHRWSLELLTPRIIFLNYFFVPIALFGAVLQDASVKIGEALDHMGIVVEVTKRQPAQVDLHAREGCYVYGPSLEGAAWDPLTQCLQEATASNRDGAPLPVLIIRATSHSKIDRTDTYACPLYKTSDRGSGCYVTTLHLRTKVPASTWTLRGTALILDGMY